MSQKSRLKQRLADGRMRWPTRDELAVKLQQVATEKSEWAGIPMLMEDFPLTLEPRYPYRLHIDTVDTVCETGYDIEIVNSWFCERLGVNVQIVKEHGILSHRLGIGHNKITMLINTLGASMGWLPSAEAKAHEKLRELITEHAMRCYMMTGMFLETSKRSGVTYLFRKLRPTLAMSAVNGEMKGLCALCLHPIGYYEGSWCGAMVPTDDVIAHLVFMRGDEHKFWAHANQHPFYRHEAGL